MKKNRHILIYVLLCMLFFAHRTGQGDGFTRAHAQTIFATQDLIMLPENIMSHETVLKEISGRGSPASQEEQVQLGLLYFRDALFTFDKDKAEKNYLYWESMYKSGDQFKHPFIKAYMGSSLALWGGALPLRKVGKKTEYLEKGLEYMDEALVEAQNRKTEDGSKDYLLSGFILFLRGTSLSNVPRFVKVSREGEDNLKDAIKDLNRLDNKQDYNNLIANVYLSFAQFYLTSKKTDLARKNLDQAETFVSNADLRLIITQYRKEKKL